ncbi:iron complex transport system substrate-binding protein [Micromonospora pallida]|uniref:Iron complex transport system substrate-binding protein n=1 Tax=Micromonospora pallida TaxID=145854 RepID=A0A1C6S1Y1_9ACTN|nr:ABC transporter substrate-binding protein [Micromonospora pallida]SCL23491.1 iron complex transport system substrate-binding protein [Micromonospora pallida]
MTTFPPGRRTGTTRTLAAGLAAALLLTACGAEVADTAGTRSVTVPRCGEQVTYTTPRRVVAYEGGSADKLFALGLTAHVHGYVMPPANPPVTGSPWAAEYARVRFLSDDLLNKELVVAERADLVVAGWNSGFSDKRGITPEILDGLGIQSFLHTESCFNYPGFPERVTPFEGLYTDLDRLGRIFGVEERAADLVRGYRQRVEAVRAQAPAERLPVFLYDSGTDQPFTAARQVPPTDIISLAGGRNIFADLDARWTQVSWEAVVRGRPEVIIVLDYGDKPAREKIAFLKSFPATRNLPAVREDRFFVLDYNEGISSPRNIDGLEKFAAYLRGLPR